MKTIEIKLYKFDELSEEAKQNAIEKLWDINVDYDWWMFTYDDAEDVGLKITGFDIDRGNYCNGDVLTSHIEIADKILENHGEHCDTYKLAKEFMSNKDALVEKYSDQVETDVVAEENEYDFDNECDALEENFLQELLECYKIMLSNEYEYLISEKAIIETIQANDYEFTADGKLY